MVPMQTDSARGPGRQTLIGCLMLLILTCMVYAPSVSSGFIWDDDAYIHANPLVHATDGVAKFWFSTKPVDYYPLTLTTFWLEWRIWGMNAGPYHIANILLHAIGIVLLWRVFRLLQVPGAWFAALVVGVHPVCVESVSWITERKNVLSQCLAVSSTLLYLQFRLGGTSSVSKRLYFTSLFLFSLALLAKTSVAMLPVAMVLVVWWRVGRLTKSDLLRVLPFVLVALVLSLVTIWYQYGRAIGAEIVRPEPFSSRLAVAGMAVWFYLFKVVFPANLCMVYPRWEIDPQSPLVYLPGIAVVGTLSALWLWRRRPWARSVLTGYAAYVVILLPVLGFFDIYFMRYSLVADHWQYAALPCIVALVVGGATSQLHRWEANAVVARAVAALCAVALGAQSWCQQASYKNQETLWKETIRVNPSAWLAHNNLGNEYVQQGRIDEGLPHLMEAVRLKPDYPEAHNNIGMTLCQLGDVDAGAERFLTAIGYWPHWDVPHYNLAVAMLKCGRDQDAERLFRRVLELNPDDAEAHYNLGTLLVKQGRMAEAVREFRDTLRTDPNHRRAAHNLAAALSVLEKRVPVRASNR